MAKRILLLITDLELGGTPTVVRELAIRLHRLGVDVEVACLSGWGPVAEQLKSAGVPVTALDARGPRDLRVSGRLVRLIRARRFTTVFSFLMHANAMAGLASLRMKNVRWIQSIQTTQPYPRWHWIVQRIAQYAADTIVVPSQSVAATACACAGVAMEKIRVIPNAIDPMQWINALSTIPSADPRPYPITFLGRLDPIKDLPTLVSAAALLKPLVHLHIYGHGADQRRIEEAIRASDAPATMHGAVASPQAALMQSGMLILPSLAEGFGLVLIEAMTANVPVVASDVPGIRDVVRNEETGLLVPPSNPKQLASAIRKLVDSKNLRMQFVEHASRDVRDRFSWDQVIKRYRDLLGV